MQYNVGIIGCGMIFKRHLEAIQENKKNFSLKAICDIDSELLNSYKKELSVEGFFDYKDMLLQMKNKINLVVIATPNSFHYQQAIDALKAGYDILIEKPIDFDVYRLVQIDELAKKLGRNAYGVLQVRYNPTIQMIQEILEKKYLGDIRSVSLIQRWQRPPSYFDSWRADINIGGRTLYEVGIHYLDIIQLLFGVPQIKSTSVFNNKHINVGFEDTIFSIIQFPSGASGSIEVTIAAEPCNLECSISIMGSKGYIKIGGKALDKIETYLFENPENKKDFELVQNQYNGSLDPNSYGTHAGSCPNHPTLYAEIAKGAGISVTEAMNGIKFIKEIYKKDIA